MIAIRIACFYKFLPLSLYANVLKDCALVPVPKHMVFCFYGIMAGNPKIGINIDSMYFCLYAQPTRTQ